VSAASDAPFSRRSAAWLAALAAGSLAAAAFLGAYGELLGDPPTWGSDSFSRSAIGHRAFTDLVRRLGFTVLVSRHATARRAGDDVVTLLLEPATGVREGPRQGRLRDIAAASGRMLLVLPKWSGPPDPLHPGWLASPALVPTEEALAPLLALQDEGVLDRDLEASLVRPAKAPEAWRGPLPAPILDRPQLLRSKALTPLLETDEGMLVGELDEEELHLLVVSDPDLIATHGLGRGENAALAVALLTRLGAGPRAAILVDETLHGHEIQPSLTRELLRFPLLLATLQALVAGGLLAWAALVRFGRPRPPEPALRAGTAFLVESAAGLLHHGGHTAHAVEAYWRAAKEAVLRQGHLRGEGAADPELALRRLLEARGRLGSLPPLEARVRRLGQRRIGVEEEAVRTAREIHRWREELTDGAAGSP